LLPGKRQNAPRAGISSDVGFFQFILGDLCPHLDWFVPSPYNWWEFTPKNSTQNKRVYRSFATRLWFASEWNVEFSQRESLRMLVPVCHKLVLTIDSCGTVIPNFRVRKRKTMHAIRKFVDL
jgi:hypothetical protein